MKRCLNCKKENKTGGEWCSVKCEDDYMDKANELTDDDFSFNEDSGKLEINMKRFEYKTGPMKKQILKMQESHEIIGELGKEWYDIFKYIRNNKIQRGKMMCESLLLTEENKQLKEIEERLQSRLVIIKQCAKVGDKDPYVAQMCRENIILLEEILEGEKGTCSECSLIKDSTNG